MHARHQKIIFVKFREIGKPFKKKVFIGCQTLFDDNVITLCMFVILTCTVQFFPFYKFNDHFISLCQFMTILFDLSIDERKEFIKALRM